MCHAELRGRKASAWPPGRELAACRKTVVARPARAAYTWASKTVIVSAGCCTPLLHRPAAYKVVSHSGSSCRFPDQSRFAHRLATAQYLRLPPCSGMRLARVRAHGPEDDRSRAVGPVETPSRICLPGVTSRPAAGSCIHTVPEGTASSSLYWMVTCGSVIAELMTSRAPQQVHSKDTGA
jgi:hypothetical protein